jgi:hypothetical protein
MSWLERRRDVLHGNFIEGRRREEMTDDDPNEAYEVVLIESGGGTWAACRLVDRQTKRHW